MWNLIGSILPMLVGVVCIPFLLKNLGVEKFGVLTLIWTLIGYFNIFDFGIGRALTYSISNLKSESNPNKMYDEVKMGLKFLLITGFIGGILLSILSKQLSFKWLNVNSVYQGEALYSILVSAIGIPFTTYTSGLRGILEGFEEFKIVNILKLNLGVLSFLLPVLSIVFFGDSLIVVVVGLVLIRVFVLFLHHIFVFKKISLDKVLSAETNINIKKNEMFRFGAWMTLSNIVSPLMVNADRFFISFFLGASVVAFYTVPFDLVIRLLIIPAAFTGVLFPRFSSLLSAKHTDTAALYKKSLMTVFRVMLLVTIITITFSYIGLKFWINEEMANKSYKILIVVSIGVFFNSMAQVPHSLIQAAGKVKLTSILHIFEFFIYVLLLVFMLNKMGLIGAAITFSLRSIVDFLALLVISKNILSVNDKY